eukprot:TRINITY_DN1260_c0_g1_i1.p1 TRINITY_DN1260_c0_g1~~TRINITY_DN1260_c0_g1_i1.p1  ORF type:complete len:229 (+),score=87.63 TRINITY_DN1260_c0_g1_i1:56-742(+)
MKKAIVVMICCIVAAVVSPVSSSKLPIPDNNNNNNVAVVGGVECDVCDFLVGLIEHFVGLNWTESKILDKVATECDDLITPSYVSACKTLVEGEGAVIYNLVLQKENASVICAQINACTNKDKPKPITKSSSSSSSSIPLFSVENEDTMQQAVCEWAAAVAQQYLALGKKEEEVLDSVYVACNVLSEKRWVAECSELVNNEGELMMALLSDSSSPKKVCDELTPRDEL